MTLSALTFLMTTVRVCLAATQVKLHSNMPSHEGGCHRQLDVEGAEIPPDDLVGEPVACEARREGEGRGHPKV